MPKLIDAHTHIQFASYGEEVDTVIKRALDEDIWVINVGTQIETSKDAITVAEKYEEGVYATVGIHPTHTGASYLDTKELGDSEKAKEFTSKGEEFNHDTYKKLAEHDKVVAIGECGLDYFRLDEGTKEKQIDAFIKHIELANEVGKPLMIHCREAFVDLINTLREHSNKLSENAGIIHFMSGSIDDAKALMDLGFSFSFGGVITFTHDYDQLINSIGINRIILETDAPYVTPAPHRGKRNEPAFVKFTAEKLGEILAIPTDEVSWKTTTNAWEIFGI